MRRILISFTPLVGQGRGKASSTEISELVFRPDSLLCFCVGGTGGGRSEGDNGKPLPSQVIFF